MTRFETRICDILATAGRPVPGKELYIRANGRGLSRNISTTIGKMRRDGVAVEWDRRGYRLGRAA